MTVTLGALAVLLACTDVTTPIRDLFAPASKTTYLNPSGLVVVWPGNMRGWVFQKGPANPAACPAPDCQFVQGPGTPASGGGSAELFTTFVGDPPQHSSSALVLADYRNTRFDQLTELRYANYRRAIVLGSFPPATLEFVVDYDLTDQLTGSQGRLVYDPARSGGFTVAPESWQTWDAKSGKWWGTQASVQRGGHTVTNPCVSATPCTWSELLAAFPNSGVHTTLGAVVLNAPPGGSSGVRTNVDKLEIGIGGTTTTFDFETVSPTPAQAPLGTPVSVVANEHTPSNILDNPPSISGKATRHTLWVQFSANATVAQKDSALALVGADVIGGMYLHPSNGHYYIRLRNAVAVPPDSVSGPVLRAERTLEQLPYVRMVLLDRIGPLTTVFFRRPKDGQGFQTWQLNPDSANGGNWHLEATNAPFAWGCRTGGSSASVGVVDRWFKRAPDLDANVTGTQEYYLPALDTSQVAHGTFVAGLLAAKGDNQSAITGMAYNQTISLYNADLTQPNLPDSTWFPLANIKRAAASNMIVNVSMGREQTGTPTADDYKNAARMGALMIDALPFPFVAKPLVVIAAGNDGVDAILSGYPDIRDTLVAKQVLVVGGTQQGPGGVQLPLDRMVNGKRLRTNTGPKVEIAAPAVVVTIGPGDTLSYAVGTSVAAPQVSGAAALLLDFDPSLSGDELKDLLIRGAVAGGRFIVDPADANHQIPILNVYESLKLAAQRPGAPLCGNRAYSTATGDVFADRGANPAEKLFNSTDGQPYTDLLNTLHGGRRIQIGDYLEFKWMPATRTWAPSSFDGAYHQDAGGAFLSWYDGSDHDGSAYAISFGVLAERNVVWTPQVMTAAGNPLKALAQVTRPLREVNGAFVCANGVPGFALESYCSPDPALNRVFAGSWVVPGGSLAAFAPQGNFVLQGVNYRFKSANFAPTYGVSGQLVLVGAAQDSSVSLELWKVDTASGSVPQQLPIDDAGARTRDGLSAEWVAIAETGTEFVWQIGRFRMNGNTVGCTQRAIEYRALPSHPTVQAGQLLRPAIALPDADQCRSFGPATFSPFMTPGATPTMSGQRARKRAAQTAQRQ